MTGRTERKGTDMSLHANKRLWQRHVLAENRRSIEGLLATLSAEGFLPFDSGRSPAPTVRA